MSPSGPCHRVHDVEPTFPHPAVACLPKNGTAPTLSSWVMTWLVPAISLIMTGCFGYHAGSVARIDYRSVAIPMFRNSTVTPQIEAKVTNAIIGRLQNDGTLRVESKETADVIVNGEIINYDRTVLRTELEDTGVPREYRMEITARIEVKDQRTGEVILPLREFVDKTDAFIGSDLQSADYQALPLIADDLARQVVTMLTDRWDE